MHVYDDNTHYLIWDGTRYFDLFRTVLSADFNNWVPLRVDFVVFTTDFKMNFNIFVFPSYGEWRLYVNISAWNMA